MRADERADKVVVVAHDFVYSSDRFVGTYHLWLLGTLLLHRDLYTVTVGPMVNFAPPVLFTLISHCRLYVISRT